MAALPAETGTAPPGSELFNGLGSLGILRQLGLLIGLAAK